MSRLAVIAAGGTGGHMFPAQALAEALLDRGWRVRLSTDDRGARYAGGFPDAVEIVVAKSATFARGGLLAKTAVPLRIAAGTFATLLRMRREKPAIVVGFGGYPAIPAMAAATFLGLPRMIHEANGVLGRVNELFARRVDKVACGIWPTDLPSGTDAVHTGNPVRAGILARAGAGYIPPGDHPMSILIMGGSQGARILSDVVPAGLAALPEPIKSNIRVAHQARAEDTDRVTEAYFAAGIQADIRTFFDDVPDRLAEAQLYIGRSGASTVADVSVVGRPAVFVPFAAATGDHQSANARGVSEAGGADVMPETALTPENLARCVAAILGNPERATTMAAAALACGMPDATERLVTLVEELAQSEG